MQAAATMGVIKGLSAPSAPSGLNIVDNSVCIGLGAFKPEAGGSWATPGANVSSITVVWEQPTGTVVATHSLGGAATTDAYVAAGTTTNPSTTVKMTVTFTNAKGSASTSTTSTLTNPC